MSYYLMHRGWMEHHLFENARYSEREAWCWLIENASFAPSKMRHHREVIAMGRGDIPTSYRKLSDKWKWSVNTVRGFLAMLIADGMISVKTDTGFLVITICNYDKYQFTEKKADTTPDTHPDTHPDTGSDTTPDTNINKGIKKDKELKEKKGGDNPSPALSRMPFVELPFEWKVWAAAEKGWDDSIIADVWANFRHHWVDGKGRSTKRGDWSASWRTWCRKENYSTKSGMQNGQKSKFTTGLEGIAAARAKRLAAEQGQAG